MERVILHCDLNNFFASVEIATDKSLGGNPIVVAGDPENRHGIVLAKNQLAKNCGIKTGDLVSDAYAKCPSVIAVKPHYEKYTYYSEKVKDIYRRFTDKIESFGIDECWLDVTDSIKLFGTGKEIADKLRKIVNDELNLTISVGVSFTKTFAKLGSDYKKPDATTVISKENYKEIAWNLPVGNLLMVGKKTEEKLIEMNIRTIGDLANTDPNFLNKKFGIIGPSLISSARGEENDPVKFVDEKTLPKSVSNGTTTKEDMKDLSSAKTVIYALCDQIAYRLRELNMNCSGVGITCKYNDFKVFNRNKKTPYPIDNSTDIANFAIELLENMDFSIPLRSITVNTYALQENSKGLQITFENKLITKHHNFDTALDKIKSKYGNDSIVRGVLINNNINKELNKNNYLNKDKK